MNANADAICDEARDWLAKHWDAERLRSRAHPDGGPKGWLREVFAARWAVLRWPQDCYGRGLDDATARLVEREFARVGAPGAGQDLTNIPANTLRAHGQEPLKRELLAGFLNGDLGFCLLYSEPGAGSDLASVRTRAEWRGDHWAFTGQKVWTSGGHKADYGLLLARTDWSVPKHQGLSFFYLPMKQPGVTIRPLHQITGDSHFNEVFLDGARAPAENLVGPLNAGWRVLQSALAVERLIMGEGAGERRQGAATLVRADLIDLARRAGRLQDPIVRQALARALARRQLNELNIARAKTELAAGRSTSILSLGKLSMSQILHGDAAVMTLIAGPETLLDGEANPLGADVNYRAMNAYMTSIGGGTDQIQRNIIAERVLGLPREIEVDRDIPFDQSRANLSSKPGRMRDPP